MLSSTPILSEHQNSSQPAIDNCGCVFNERFDLIQLLHGKLNVYFREESYTNQQLQFGDSGDDIISVYHEDRLRFVLHCY